MKNKELTPLKAHKELKSRYGKYFSLQDDERAKVIENALKEKEQQDNVLKVLKEIIEFATVLPHVEPNEDNGFSIMSGVGINIQRNIENKERELLRQWVLETCFPKELKALEIMKTKLGIEKEDFFYDDVLGYMFVGNVVSKEEYDLLKEVLL